MIHLFTGLTIFIDFSIAVYVLLKNPRGPVHRSFFTFVFGIALWGGGIFLLAATRWFFLNNIILFGGHFMVLGLVLLAKTFPEAARIGKKFWLALLPFTAIFILTPFNVFIKGLVTHPDGSIEPLNGPLILPLVAFVGAYVLLSVALFASKYRRLSGIPRLQLQYLFTGTSIFAVAMFIFNVLLPAFGVFQLNIIGPLTSIIFIGFTAYAIIRHQLMDIRIVIQKSLFYSMLFAVVVACYLILLFVLQMMFKNAADLSSVASAGITTVLGISGAPYIEKYFRRLTDKFFFMDRIEYSEAMHQLSEAANKNFELDGLVDAVSAKLKKIFKTGIVEIALLPHHASSRHFEKHVATTWYSKELATNLRDRPEIIVHSEIPYQIISGEPYADALLAIQKVGSKKGHAVTAPIMLGEKAIGLVNLGGKLSGEAYTLEDLKLLRTFSYQAAVAITKAELYQEVKEYSRALEDRVHERTAKLQELQEGQKQMMINISHALQTPLTIVKGELDVLKRKMPVGKNFDAFEKSVDNVSRLTYDLLRLARLETSEDDAPKEKVDVSTLINDVIEYFTVLAKDRSIKVTSTIDPGIKVAGNKDQLEELARNLLSNAIKYMPHKGRKEVRIVLGQNGSKARLAITDTGIGIARGELPHIFNPFYRGDQSGSVEGSGLGLAIAKAIVDRHGGTIDVRSTPDEGTTFTIALPIVG